MRSVAPFLPSEREARGSSLPGASVQHLSRLWPLDAGGGRVGGAASPGRAATWPAAARKSLGLAEFFVSGLHWCTG